MIGLLNIGSLVLGLIAWILPAANLMRNKSENQGNWLMIGLVSMTACVIALFFQIFYNYHLVKIEDWSALMDTTGGVVVAATVLIFVTIVLNAVNLIFIGKCQQDRPIYLSIFCFRIISFNLHF